MGTFIAYLLKVAFCLLILFAFNKLVLSRETFHRYNRWAWLGVIALSLVLPLANFKFWELFSVAGETVAIGGGVGDVGVLPEADGFNVAAPAANPFRSFVFWGALAYFIGAVGVMVAFAVSYIELFRLLVRAREGREFAAMLLKCKENVGYYGKVRLLITGEKISPMSWMHYIIMNEEDVREDGKAILIHELSHIKAGHSWDMLLADILIIFQWFNPAAWLLKQSLQQVQEYGADSSVLEAGVDAHDYQLLLIKKAVGQRLYSMANSFNHSKLKNRITMMLKEKSSKWAYAKCLYIIPLALVTIGLSATPKVSSVMGLISEVKVSEKSVITDTIPKTEVGVVEEVSVVSYGEAKYKVPEGDTIETVPYASLDEKPKFFGKDPNEFSRWVGKNLQYPAEAKKAGTQGRVTLQFIIDETGKVGNVKTLQGMINKPYSDLLNAEAVRVVSSSPDWIPGIKGGRPVKVFFNFPVIFQIDNRKKENAAAGAASGDGEEVNGLPEGCAAYASLDVKPSFSATVGGMTFDSFSKWAGMQMIYPELAKKNKITGRVTVQFVIDTDGALTDVHVLRGVSPELDAEAIRVVESSPKWTPAMKDGKSVKVQMNFPMVFQLR